MSDPLDEFRRTPRAVEIVDAAARAGMTPAEIAAFLGVSESALRAWRKRPKARIEDEATARRLRRLAYTVQPKEAS